MSDYNTDRLWSDKLIPQMHDIISSVSLGAAGTLTNASIQVDCKEAADAVITFNPEIRIAYRTRKAKHHARYGNQFTVRSKRHNGITTEWEKILRGYGHWMLYAWTNEQDIIEYWTLISLHALREQWFDFSVLNIGQIDTDEIPNKDGTYFRWFDISSFRPGLIIDSSEERQRKTTLSKRFAELKQRIAV